MLVTRRPTLLFLFKQSNLKGLFAIGHLLYVLHLVQESTCNAIDGRPRSRQKKLYLETWNRFEMTEPTGLYRINATMLYFVMLLDYFVSTAQFSHNVGHFVCAWQVWFGFLQIKTK